MRELYTYEISTVQDDGRWRLSRADSESSARTPGSIARALIERWVIGNRDKLTGGERIVVPSNIGIPGKMAGKVRVQVFRGARGPDQRPVAVAYLAHSENDYPALRPVGRIRRRIRLARSRADEPESLRPAGPPVRPVPLGDAA